MAKSIDEGTYPRAIIAAIHAVMEEVGYVQKKGRNDFHGYSYAGEADLLKSLRPAMLKNGLVLIPSSKFVGEPDQHGNTHVRIDYTLAHVDGEVWPEKVSAIGSGNDRNSKGGVGDKGAYKAMTGANKYLLFKLFQIETGDDPEASGADGLPPTPTPDEYRILHDTILQEVRMAPDLGELQSVWKGYASDLGDIKANFPDLFSDLESEKDAKKTALTKGK